MLRLKTFPLAIKLLRDETDIPDGAIRPKRNLKGHLTLCQAFALSRRAGNVMAMLREDMWCYIPVIALGLSETPEYFLEGHMYYPEKVSSPAVARKVAESLPRLAAKKFIGVLSAPLKKAVFEPDLVLVYCNSFQLRCLLLGLRYKEGYQVRATMYGGNACVSSIVPAISNQQCQVAVPCGGDSAWAHAEDDEMIFSAPKDKIQDLLEGLWVMEKSSPMLPVNFALKADVDIPESYIKMGKKLKMETHIDDHDRRCE